LLVVLHHLVVDGVSWRILLEDLEVLLSAIREGREPDLGRKTSSYRQWYEALQRYGGSRRVLLQRSYWEGVVSEYRGLPVDKEYAGDVRMDDRKGYQVGLGREVTQRLLQEAPRVYHTEINDILLCGLAKVLCGWMKSDRVVIGLEGHGRELIWERLDTSRTVGWFTSLHPVLLSIKGGKEAGDRLKGIKEQLRSVPDKGLGYGVLKYMNRAAGLQGKAPWDMVFNYLGQLDNVVGNSSWFSGVPESSGSNVGARYVMEEKLSVVGMVAGGELMMSWTYSTLHYREETIKALAEGHMEELRRLVEHCVERGRKGTEHTPSDYGLTGEVSYKELDDFLNAEGSEMSNVMDF